MSIDPFGIRFIDPSKFDDDYPTATVKLVDALDGYIRASEQFIKDALDDGWWTLDQAKVERDALDQHRRMLTELRAEQPCMDLFGLIKA